MNKLLRKKAPDGWNTYNDEWRYTFKIQPSRTNFYKSAVHYNYLNGNTYIALIGRTDKPINEAKKEIAAKFKSYLQFNKYLLVVDTIKANTDKIFIQFHAVLLSFPTEENILALQKECL